MDQSINLIEKFEEIESYFFPKVIGRVDDMFIKLAKIKGEKIPWHHHKEQDELFLILEGSLQFEIENQGNFVMNKGDLFVVKRGVNHRVSSDEECKIMLIEHQSTLHTGEEKTEITRSIRDQLSP